MTKRNDDDLIREGKAIYQERLEHLLEPDHAGKYVAIEPESGDYYLGRTMSEAYEQASAAHPEKRFYLARVGSRSAVSFKHRASL